MQNGGNRAIGTTIGGIEIHDVTELESYLRENSIDIAVLTLPREAALKVCDSRLSIENGRIIKTETARL